jgi:hypothetical protein
MAHFAQLDAENIVVQVLVLNNEVITENGNESETKGIDFLQDLLGSDITFIQTSYNASFRGKFAGIGDVWDGVNFVTPDNGITPGPMPENWDKGIES